jgi:site-specific recombinase XerD
MSEAETKQRETTISSGPLGRVYRRPNSPHLWIEYWHLGHRKRENCGSSLVAVAKRLLRKRQSEVEHQGKLLGPQVEKTRYHDLERALLQHFDRHEKYSEPQARKSVDARLARLRQHFGRMFAVEIGYSEIEQYVEKRKRQPRSSASTIATEVRWLHLAMVRGVADKLLAQVPVFPRVEKSPPREGSATPEEIARLIAHLPGYLRPLVTVQYVTGWRSKHLREMTWAENVLPGPALFLPKIKGNKKRAKDVVFDCSEAPWLVDLIERQRRRVAELTLALGKGRDGITFVFPSAAGDQITWEAYKSAWTRARKRAGLPKLRSHDNRRSATQNDRQLGIDKRVRMDLVGHKSEAIHDAYDSAARPELKEAVRTIGNFLAPVLAPVSTDTQGDTQPPGAETAAS